METSLRYSRDSKSLRIHAKQKLHIDSGYFLQAHGELDTKFGTPSYFSALLRRSYPEFSTKLGLGVQYDKQDKLLRYTVRGKKAFAVTSDGSVNFNIKGRCNASEDFKERRSTAAAEFTWSKLDFQKDQDVRFKVGYNIIDKVPYLQVRENNWTLNANAKGMWNVRYDL